jgi:hypothetical protein
MPGITVSDQEDRYTAGTVHVSVWPCVRSDVYWGHARAGKRVKEIPSGTCPNAHQTQLGGGMSRHMAQ